MTRRLAILLVLGITIVGGCSRGVSATAAPTVDPSIAAALAPTCTGHGVSGAGKAAVSGNHLVVLDEMGNELHMVGQFANTSEPSEFKWQEPAHWIPATLADAELVACVQAVETYTLEQICEYDFGQQIQRFAATREVRVVEAATGREIDAIVIHESARECGVREQDVDALYGVITDWDVWNALEDVVANGTMYE